MSRSLSNLHRALLGIAFAGSLGFGATQAFAGPTTAALRLPWCDPNDPNAYAAVCTRACQRHGYTYGYCGADSFCACTNDPLDP